MDKYTVKLNDKHSLVLHFDAEYSDRIFKFKSAKLTGNEVYVDETNSYYYDNGSAYILSFNVDIKEFNTHAMFICEANVDYENDLIKEPIQNSGYIPFEVVEIKLYEDNNEHKNITIDECISNTELDYVSWIREEAALRSGSDVVDVVYELITH